MNEDFDKAIENLIEVATADYAKWCGQCGVNVANQPFDLDVRHGRAYTKILRMKTDRAGNLEDGSVWGFVVRKDGAKFKRGDILKAATWKAPATNHARGNIFTGFSGVQWTGPTYCGTDAQNENIARQEMQEPLDDLTAI